ncbi:MAG: hypothetical protein AAF050_01995 [Cyanobacteria bacterium J06649_5]
MTEKTTSYSEPSILELIEESEVSFSSTTETIRRRKVFSGTTNTNGRSRLPRTQYIERDGYPFGFTILAFENFGGTSAPSETGAAVFVIEDWEVLGIVGIEGGLLQWSVNAEVQARDKKENGAIQGNLFEHSRYEAELTVAVIVEYYVSP